MAGDKGSVQNRVLENKPQEHFSNGKDLVPPASTQLHISHSYEVHSHTAIKHYPRLGNLQSKEGSQFCRLYRKHGWGGLRKLTVMAEGEADTSFFTWWEQGEQ